MGTDTATNQEEERITTNISTSFEHGRVISMLHKSGCLDSHFKVQDCMVDHKGAVYVILSRCYPDFIQI